MLWDGPHNLKILRWCTRSESLKTSRCDTYLGRSSLSSASYAHWLCSVSVLLADAHRVPDSERRSAAGNTCRPFVVALNRNGESWWACYIERAYLAIVSPFGMDLLLRNGHYIYWLLKRTPMSYLHYSTASACVSIIPIEFPTSMRSLMCNKYIILWYSCPAPDEDEGTSGKPMYWELVVCSHARCLRFIYLPAPRLRPNGLRRERNADGRTTRADVTPTDLSTAYAEADAQ